MAVRTGEKVEAPKGATETRLATPLEQTRGALCVAEPADVTGDAGWHVAI